MSWVLVCLIRLFFIYWAHHVAVWVRVAVQHLLSIDLLITAEAMAERRFATRLASVYSGSDWAGCLMNAVCTRRVSWQHWVRIRRDINGVPLPKRWAARESAWVILFWFVKTLGRVNRLAAAVWTFNREADWCFGRMRLIDLVRYIAVWLKGLAGTRSMNSERLCDTRRLSENESVKQTRTGRAYVDVLSLSHFRVLWFVRVCCKRWLHVLTKR